MAYIILNNTKRTVTLKRVKAYVIDKNTTYPVKKIPAKQKPTMDATAWATTPRTYNITAHVSETNREDLLSLEDDREMITLNDGSTTDDNCFLDNLGFTYFVGRGRGAGFPLYFPIEFEKEFSPSWLCSISLLSSSN